MTLSYFVDPGIMEFAAIFGPFSTLSPGENARSRLSPYVKGGLDCSCRRVSYVVGVG